MSATYNRNGSERVKYALITECALYLNHKECMFTNLVPINMKKLLFGDLIQVYESYLGTILILPLY